MIIAINNVARTENTYFINLQVGDGFTIPNLSPGDITEIGCRRSVVINNKVERNMWVFEAVELPQYGNTPKSIGYHCWTDTSDEDDHKRMRVEYLLYRDGSARKQVYEDGLLVDEFHYNQGEYIVYSPLTKFGSRGGYWIGRLVKQR